jgi:hypothetical protein
VFSKLKSDNVTPAKEEIEKEFLSNMEEIKLSPETFGPRKCYRYEGIK